MKVIRITGNKRGDAMIEAAFVLPLFILTILSVILLALYFYAGLGGQLKTQADMISQGQQSGAVIRVLREEQEGSGVMRGTVQRVLTRKYKGKHYVINMTEAIRLGKGISDEDE